MRSFGIYTLTSINHWLKTSGKWVSDEGRDSNSWTPAAYHTGKQNGLQWPENSPQTKLRVPTVGSWAGVHRGNVSE